MEKRFLRCYSVFCTLAILFLVGYNHHDKQERVAVTLEQLPVISSVPLPSKSKSPVEEGVWNVVQVVDGDTLIVGDSADREKQYRIRLIGADTPETVSTRSQEQPFGRDASDFTKQKNAESGNRVRIAFDGEQLDRFKRTLAMVYLPMPDGKEVWLNELLIREGLAHVRFEYRYSHGAKLAFAVAEMEARKNKRNLWRDGVE